MIGVFDSGLGGLTILKQFLAFLPEYNYLYLGDNLRAPYGNKSQKAIYNNTRQAVEFLFKNNCELIIVACNTASARALRKIQREWLPKNNSAGKVLGVITPVVEKAAKINRGNRIGVIGTEATISSGAYEKELSKFGRNLKVYNQKCPRLVSLVEEGRINGAETKIILKKYLQPLKDKKIDTLILACTHYPFLIAEIEKIMGKNCQILNPPEIVAGRLKDYLGRHFEIENKLGKAGKRIYHSTGDFQKFKQFGEKFLGETIKIGGQIEL
ncbi:MAG: glutamate racemase [Candidatus Pacebacteria bacterium]|nr:glutamate racemase [Candidatus Paceibacterota bacterium]